MRRDNRRILYGLAIVSLMAGQAHAQYYYPTGYGAGGYGFGGWGGDSAVGDIARGFGAYAAGKGAYEVDDAQAGSINTDTVLRFNQYLYNSSLEAQRRYNASKSRRMNLDKANYDAHLARLRDNPTEADIASGDALNTILDQLSNPKLMNGSALRLANGNVSPQAIRDIPFRDETDAITISLDELTDQKSWPLPLRSDEFTPEREAYIKAVDDALEEDKDGGSLKPETVKRVRDSVARLYAKVNDTIPKTKQPDHLQAMNYLKGLAGMSRMLEKPNVESILSELEKVKTTTVGNLISFMHAYNLRFASADTPKQRAVYRDLYASLSEAREKIMGKPGDANATADQPPLAPVENPTALFHGMDATHLNPK